MSILSKQETIKEGDIVIAYSNPSCIKPIRITKDATFGNRFGQFHHNSIINKKYGSKIESKNQKSYFYALFPTPELWTRTVPHRTQILYQADISLITMMLEMRPGTVMIEAGTGSGSFSHSIARTIAPNGTLFTFEYNQTRAEICKQEFLEHGISNAIIEHRDVCKDGFGDVGNVDCVFLDLPSPWLALQHAANSFANDRIGKICTFSPCIEQVTTTCAELHKLGFQGNL